MVKFPGYLRNKIRSIEFIKQFSRKCAKDGNFPIGHGNADHNSHKEGKILMEKWPSIRKYESKIPLVFWVSILLYLP